MSQIKVNYSDPAKQPQSVITLNPRQRDESTSLTLFGLGAQQYSQAIQQAFLWLLENFASETPPSKPTEGQLWFDKGTNTLKVAVVATPFNVGPPVIDEVLSWRTVGGVLSQSTPPSNVERLWYDTSTSELKIHNGTSYVSVVDLYVRLSGDSISGTLDVPLLRTESTVTVNGPVTVNGVSKSVEFIHNNPILTLVPGVELINASSRTILNTGVNNDAALISPGDVCLCIGNDTSTTQTLTIRRGTSDLFNINRNVMSFLTPVNMNTSKIINVPQPTLSSHAVPYSLINDLQNHVDTFVYKTGDTMTGELTVDRPYLTEGTRVSPNVTIINGGSIHITNTANGSLRIQKTAGDLLQFIHYDGITSNVWMSLDLNNGNLNVNSRKISGVDTPTSDYELANKRYVTNVRDLKLAEYQQLANKQKVRGWVMFDGFGNILNSYGCIAAVTRVVAASRIYYDVSLTGIPANTRYCYMTYGVETMPSASSGSGTVRNIVAPERISTTRLRVSMDSLTYRTVSYSGDARPYNEYTLINTPWWSYKRITVAIYY